MPSPAYCSEVGVEMALGCLFVGWRVGGRERKKRKKENEVRI
jgi:hypothetical protein